VINADGSGQKQLTNIPSGGVCFPGWSPDREKIAFTVFDGKTPMIHIADKNGDHVTRIIEGIAAHWSPDGTHIAFLRYSDARGSKGSIWIANADGSDAKKIFEDTYAFTEPTWYPDGRNIVFAVRREHTSTIFRLNLDGTNLAELARDDKMGFLDPIFSPDGKQLIVALSTNHQTRNHR
ncbi:MAG: hypothetical protein WA869_09155, partial [Alloacidobacterium sp.]